MLEVGKTILRVAFPDGQTAPMLYMGVLTRTMVQVRDLERIHGKLHPVRGADCAVWDCAEHGHSVTTWLEIDNTVEKGLCNICQARLRRRTAYAMSDGRTIACGLCDGTGLVQTLHERAHGLKPSRSCPACSTIDEDRLVDPELAHSLFAVVRKPA